MSQLHENNTMPSSIVVVRSTDQFATARRHPLQLCCPTVLHPPSAAASHAARRIGEAARHPALPAEDAAATAPVIFGRCFSARCVAIFRDLDGGSGADDTKREVARLRCDAEYAVTAAPAILWRCFSACCGCVR